MNNSVRLQLINYTFSDANVDYVYVYLCWRNWKLRQAKSWVRVTCSSTLLFYKPLWPTYQTNLTTQIQWMINLIGHTNFQWKFCVWMGFNNPKSFLRLSRTRPSKHARPIALAITEAAADRCRAEWNPQMHLHDSRTQEKEASIPFNFKASIESNSLSFCSNC